MEEDSTGTLSPDLHQLEKSKFDVISKLIVVRHGESVANSGGVYQGQSHDTDLSELGLNQAKALAERLKDFGIRRIVTSPLKRTYQTAFEISKVLDCEIEVRNEIIETNHGVWEGKSKNWILENFGDLYNLWLSKPSEVVFPEGEAFLDTVSRVQMFLDNLDSMQDTVLVSHDNIVRIITALSKNESIDSIWDYKIEPAGINIYEGSKMGGKLKVRLLKLNDTKHLKNLRADINKHAL